MLLLGLGAAAAVAADPPPDLEAIVGQTTPVPSADPMAGVGPTPPAVLASVRRIQSALENIASLKQPGQDGYATVWDGNKYVQCGLARGGGLRCEAAGSLMQPSMARLLTADSTERLAVLGWKLDPHFGNYVKVLPAQLTPEQDAVNILIVLGGVYGADLANLQVETDWIAHRACPPRNGPSQNLAGMINDAPTMAATAVYACAYFDPAAVTTAPEATADLIHRYGPTVSAEIQRLRVNQNRQVHVIFDADIGYIQCEPDPPAIYCEAQSAETWPAIAAVLTPERIVRLHAAGYADPGRAPNYWKDYPLDQSRDADIAAEILTLLHEVYGYAGTKALHIVTEKGDVPVEAPPR
jgi:hypothetical protein